MLRTITDAIGGQYGAALRMLQDCLEGADPAIWLAPVGKFPFWHVAYHVLFSTDMYLSPEEKAFRRPWLHREDYNFLGAPPWSPEKKVVVDKPYERDELRTYLVTCWDKAIGSVASETEATLAGPSGFHWLPFTRLELHVYNVRHLQ